MQYDVGHIIVERSPEFVDAVVELIVILLQAIANHTEDFVVAALEFITNFIKGLVRGFPDVCRSIVDLIGMLMKTLAENTIGVVNAGVDMIIAVANGIADSIDERAVELGKAAGRLAVAIGKGLILGIFGMGGAVIESLVDMAKQALAAVKNFLGIHSPSRVFDEEVGQPMALGAKQGIQNKTPEVVASAKDMASKASDAAGGWLDGFVVNDSAEIFADQFG